MNGSVAEYIRSVESRLIGRVFTYDDTLHYVLGIEARSGLAKLSCRYNDRTEVRYMPIAEVSLRVAGVLN